MLHHMIVQKCPWITADSLVTCRVELLGLVNHKTHVSGLTGMVKLLNAMYRERYFNIREKTKCIHCLHVYTVRFSVRSINNNTLNKSSKRCKPARFI